MHGPEPFITVRMSVMPGSKSKMHPRVSTVKDWSLDRWKSI